MPRAAELCYSFDMPQTYDNGITRYVGFRMPIDLHDEVERRRLAGQPFAYPLTRLLRAGVAATPPPPEEKADAV